MNILVFTVGFIIFCLYIVGLLYMINKSHKDQKKEILKDPEIPKTYKDSL